MTLFERADIQKREAERLIATRVLLLRLKHHHESQGKERTPPCSKEYNRKLAAEIAAVLAK